MNTTPAPAPAPPRVLFVGGPDAVTSRLAAGLLHQCAGDSIEVSVAQTRPDSSGERADLVLSAAGLDPAGHPAQPLSASALRRANRVISLGETVDVARVPGPRYETWDTPGLVPSAIVEPEGDLRQALAERVAVLAAELTTPSPPRPAWSLRTSITALGRAGRRTRG